METINATKPKTALQLALDKLVAESPRPRDHYDRLVQKTLGTSGKPIYDIQRGKSRRPNHETLQAIADAFEVPLSRLVETRGDLPPTNGVAVQMEGASTEKMRENMPVFGTALGASRKVDGDAIEQTTLNRSEIVHYAKRPVMLNTRQDAYGLYVQGSSMYPAHPDGSMVVVVPGMPLRIGDDVVVYLRPTDPDEDNGETARAVLIKRLVRRNGSHMELEQFTPPRVFSIANDEILRCDRVLTVTEMLT